MNIARLEITGPDSTYSITECDCGGMVVVDQHGRSKHLDVEELKFLLIRFCESIMRTNDEPIH